MVNGVSLKGDIYFKIRFNTTYGNTNLFWRVIIEEQEYLAHTVHCKVETFSESSFDARAGAIKWHMAGRCREFFLNEDYAAIFK